VSIFIVLDERSSKGYPLFSSVSLEKHKGSKPLTAATMPSDQPSVQESSRGRLLPSLFFSYFATSPPSILVGLLLIDIGVTFESPVGITGQLNTLSYVAAVIFALLMGILSVRFTHKSLLLMGLLFLNVSALGCALAPNFGLMLISYSLVGLTTAAVAPMTFTLISEHFPLEKRANAVAWLVAGGSLSYVIGAPIISIIAGYGDWRTAFYAFVLPISFLSLLLASIGVPSAPRNGQPATGKEVYLQSFKETLSCKSANACLVGNILRMASFMAVLIYGISFFRQRFLIPTNYASVIMLVAASCYTLGSLVTGRLISKFGRKPLTVLTSLLAGTFTISYAFVPNLWLSLASNLSAAWFFGMTASSASSLTLEQVPKHQGTMMSVNSAAQSFGSAFGTALGGTALIIFNYETLGTILGALGIIAAGIFFLLATDPTGHRPHNS
jgi:DHA1 family inner membrane transport protein